MSPSLTKQVSTHHSTGRLVVNFKHLDRSIYSSLKLEGSLIFYLGLVGKSDLLIITTPLIFMEKCSAVLMLISDSGSDPHISLAQIGIRTRTTDLKYLY